MWRKAVLAVVLVAISAILLVTTLPADAADNGEGTIESSEYVLYDQNGWRIILEPDSDGSYVIYDTDAVEDVADRLNVKHNGQPITEFSLTGGGQNGNFTLSSNGSNITFHVDVIINEIIELIIDTASLRDFSPGDDLNSVFEALLLLDSNNSSVVMGKMADGTIQDVTMYEVEITGSLFPGTEGHAESPIKVTLTAIHRTTGAEGPVIVDYIPKEIESVDFVIDYSGSYHAFDQVRFASITVTYEGGSSVNILETGAPYVVIYNGDNSQTSLVGGNNSIVVTYTENGTSKSSSIKVLPGVIRETIVQPSLDESVSTYSGEEIRKYFTNYDPDLMSVVSGSDVLNVQFDVTRGQYYVAVTDADENYRILIGLVDDDRYEWAVGSKNPDESGHLTFNFTVDKATYTGDEIQITGMDGWTYGSSPDTPYLEISLDDGSYVFHYSGTKRGESEINDLGNALPTEAGVWSVYATISSKNYNDFNTASVNFTISPKTVEIPSISRTYTGNPISVEDTVQIPVDYGTGSSYSIAQADSNATDVGTYNATVKLKDTANYVWNNGSSSNQSISWEITAAYNHLEISYDKLQWTYLGESGNITYDWSGGFETSGLSTIIYSDEGKINEVKLNAFGRYNVGTYYVVVTVPNILSIDGKVNVFGTTAETSFTITKETIDVVSVDSKTYSETISGTPDSIIADLPLMSIDGLGGETVLQFTDNGNPLRNQAGTYAVQLKINSNFSFSVSQTGVSSNGETVSLSFIINKAKDNSIQFTNLDNAPPPIFGEGYSWIPQAQAKYQADGTIQYYYRSDSDSSWVSWGQGPINAGTYSIKAVLGGTDDYNGCEVEKQDCFIINQKSITTKPTIKDDVEAGYVYSGNPITVFSGSATWNYWIDGAFDLSDNVQTDAGLHELTLSVTDNYRWDNNISSTADVTVEWVIQKKKIALVDDSGSAIRQVLITDEKPAIVLPDGILETDVEFGAWASDLKLNTQYSNTLTLDEDIFVNYEWDRSQPIASDQVSDDGRVLTIWYTIVGQKYSFEVTFNDTFTIDNNHLPEGVTSNTLGVIYSGNAINVEDFILSITATTEGVPSDSFNEAKKNLSITYYKNDANDSIDPPSDVEHYRFTVTIPSFGNYGESTSVFYDFYIVALKIESSVDIGGKYFEYDGSNKLLSTEFTNSLSVKDENGIAVAGSWTYSLDENGSYVSADQLNDFIDVDSYKIYYRVSAGNNYGIDEGHFVLNVSPKTIPLTLVGDLQANYDGEIPELTGISWNSFDTEIVPGDVVSPILTFEVGDNTRNVGQHTIVVNSSNSNYVFAIQGDHEFTVDPIPISEGMFELELYYDYVKDCNMAYDAQSHTLLSKDLKSWNPLNENDVCSLTILSENSGKDAKSYVVNYLITSSNYDEYKGNVTVTIDPTEIVVEVNDDSIVYGERFESDADAGLSIQGLKGEDVLSADLDDLFCLTTGYVPETATSQSYSITVELRDGASVSENYKIISYGSGTLTVKERPITLRIYDTSSVYGEQIGLRCEVTSSYKVCAWDEGKVYKLTLGDNVSSIPDVGSYPITILQNLEKSGFYDIDPDYSQTSSKINATHTVNPKEVGVNVMLPNSVYDGHEKVVSVELNDQLIGEDVGKVPVVEYKRSDEGDEEYTKQSPTDAGEYVIRLVMDDDVQNYRFKADVSMGFTIEQAQYSISIEYDYLNVPEYDGDGKELQYDITVTASGVDLDDDYTYDDVIPEGELDHYVDVSIMYSWEGSNLGDDVLPVNAGTYGARVTITSCNDNFVVPAGYTQPGLFVIDARDVDIIWTEHDDLIYNGKEITHDGWYEFQTSDTKESVNLSSKLGIVSDETEFKDSGKYIFEVELVSEKNYEIKSGSQKEYEIKPATIHVSIKDNGYFGGYTFGDLTSGDLVLDAPYPELEFSGEMSNNFETEMGSHDWISFEINSSSPNLKYSGAYLSATEHEGVVVLDYSGNDNYQLVGGPFTLDVDPFRVSVEISPQQETYTGEPIEVANKYVLQPEAQTYSQFIGISVVHGSHGVESEEDIIDVVEGGYPITAVWSNKDFVVECKDSVLIVEKVTNHWDESDGYGIEGWVYTEYNASVNGIDYPQSDYGEVKAYLVYPDGKEVEVGDDVDWWNSLDANQSAYRIKFVVDEGNNWTGLGNRAINFFVSQKELKAYWAGDGLTDGSIPFDGAEHTVTLQEYNSSIMTLGHYSDGDFNESGGTITMTESESGVYGVILTITDDNYVWDCDFTGDTSEDVFLVTWEITSLGKNSWETEPSISESWTYGESPTIQYGEPTYGKGAVQLVFYYTSGAEYGTDVPIDVGTYRAVFYVEESNNWDRLEWTKDVTISPKLLPDPSSDSKTYSYMNGSEVVYELSGLNGYEVWKDHVVVSGDKASDPGNYILVISLKEPNNCRWVDENDNHSVEAVFIPWKISNAEALTEDMFTVDVTAEEWTGHPIQKSVVATNLVEGGHFVVSYSNNTNVTSSQQLAVITITGIGAYEGSTLSYSFEINQAVADVSFYNESLKMYIEDESFLNAIELSPYVEESSLVYASSNPDVASVDPDTGAITMNRVGTTTITVTVPGTNNYTTAEASYELTISDTPVEVVDHVVYVKVPVEVPGGDDDDDPTDDKPETVYIEKDNDLYIWLLIVMAVICVCFAAYIMYTHRDQEGGA